MDDFEELVLLNADCTSLDGKDKDKRLNALKTKSCFIL